MFDVAGHRPVPGFVRLGRSLLLATTAAASLAGCAHQTTSPVASRARPPEAATSTLASLSLPERIRPQLPVTELAALKTASQAMVVAKLGQPDFVRRDAPAEIWQYRSAGCVLDLFLYPEGRDLKVALVTTRSRAAVVAPDNQCTPFGGEQQAAAKP